MKLPDFVSLATETHIVSWWHQHPGWTFHNLSVWALKWLVTHGEKCILIYMPLEIVVAVWFVFHKSTLNWADVESSVTTIPKSIQ